MNLKLIKFITKTYMETKRICKIAINHGNIKKQQHFLINLNFLFMMLKAVCQFIKKLSKNIKTTILLVVWIIFLPLKLINYVISLVLFGPFLLVRPAKMSQASKLLLFFDFLFTIFKKLWHDWDVWDETYLNPFILHIPTILFGLFHTRFNIFQDRWNQTDRFYVCIILLVIFLLKNIYQEKNEKEIRQQSSDSNTAYIALMHRYRELEAKYNELLISKMPKSKIYAIKKKSENLKNLGMK